MSFPTLFHATETVPSSVGISPRHQSRDVDGILSRTVLPVITTPNTGASDLIQSGVNGEVVPIRDPQAIADAVLKWADKILSFGWRPRALVDTTRLSFDHFEREFLRQLAERKLIGGAAPVPA